MSCKILKTGGLLDGRPTEDIIFTPNSLSRHKAFDNAEMSWRYGHCLVVLKGRVLMVGGKSKYKGSQIRAGILGRHITSELVNSVDELRHQPATSASSSDQAAIKLRWQVLNNTNYQLNRYKRMYAGCTVANDQTVWMCGGKNEQPRTSRDISNCVSFRYSTSVTVTLLPLGKLEYSRIYNRLVNRKWAGSKVYFQF